MKQIIGQIKSHYKVLLTIMATLLFLNCGTIDNLDADSFLSLENDYKNQHSQFRRYGANQLNQPPLIEFIVDNENTVSVNYNENLKKSCDYAKLPYKSTNIKSWDSLPFLSPSTRVLCLVNTRKISDASIEKITDFVIKGGTFFLPIANEDKRLAFLLGFKPEANYFTDVSAKGFYFKTPVLPNLQKGKISINDIHYGFSKENFNENIKVYATAINDQKFPTIIENPVGKGRVLLYNTQKYFEKRDRGLLFSSILKGLEGIPYPIANTSTIFLDDFPCPLFDIKSEPIASEMNLSQKDFVKKVWWPDMLKLAKKYNISYSAMVTFDYENQVQPPFLFNQWNDHKIKSENKIEALSDWFVFDAAKKGHELGFHGYNHVELMTHLWKNPNFITTALKTAEKKWKVSNFGKLPVTYVPPSNDIDKEGINTLKNTMPNLKYLCSSYNGAIEDGQNREFDFDPYNDGFFNYPRTSSGFYIDVEQKYNQQSVYLFTGIWTHFVHPDDVYQINNQKNTSRGNYEYRNPLNMGWYKTKGKKIGLFTEFDDYLNEITRAFPLIRFLNAGAAAQIVLDWRASNFSHATKNSIYTVEELNPKESISGHQYWFSYVSSKNSFIVESALKKQRALFSKTPYLEGYLYTIYTNESKLSLPDLNYKSEIQKNEWATIIEKTKKDMLIYKKKVVAFNILQNQVDNSDSKLKLEIKFLKQKMITEEKIDATTWNKYTKYMIWEDKGMEVWQLLESHCSKYPKPENILYSKQLNSITEYPNEDIKEKWMYAQIMTTPNDAKLLKDYIASFDSPENKDKIKTVWQYLLKIDPNFDVYVEYIQHLLLYDSKSALTASNKIEPSEKFKCLATDFCWLYADNNQLKKAYDWSVFSNEIDFTTKMFWLIELKLYHLLEEEYNIHIIKHPSDYKVIALFSNYKHDIGKFKEGWILAHSLPESTEKENLRAIFNKDILYVDTDLQQDLIDNYPEFIYPDIKQKLTVNNRKENGELITINSNLESNKQNPSSLKNSILYHFLDKNKNGHGLGVTFSKMYKLNYDIQDEDNLTHTLYGLQYEFKNPKKQDQLQYWSKIIGEYSDFDRFYFQLGVGGNFSKNKKYTSAELKIFPAETGPAYSKNIYRLQGNLYQDASVFGKLNVSLSLEANYYTPSKTNAKIATSDSYQGSATAKIIWDNGLPKKSKLLPFIESSYLESSIGHASITPSIGYPYWMIDSRFYAGGGVGWKLGKEESDFNCRVEAAWFYDDYSADFKRFIGNIAYQIFDYTAITTSFEIYSQSKFYSNAIQFGVKYNLKKKQKK